MGRFLWFASDAMALVYFAISGPFEPWQWCLWFELCALGCAAHCIYEKLEARRA